VVEKSHLSVVQITKLIDRSRSQLYNDFDNPDMDWTVIRKIGRAIKHDFAQDFPEFDMYASSLSEPDPDSGNDFEMQALMKQIDKWKS
ncbi:hypothetical protein, partial [Streptococcus pneumoniae]|uniref:hypothetical protein n=1 Tax=Streptococcus pneumoniae TaxID=1313 RepID=UPI001E50E072